MGADIHCYIETSLYEPQDGKDRYWSTFGGRINPGRDYEVFGILAGVRGSDEPMLPLRGLPNDVACYQTQIDAYMHVTDDPDLANSEGYCSRENAENWVRSSSSKWIDDDKSKVTHPDWHSHTWMTPEEWRQAIETPSQYRESRNPEYFAIAAAMEELQRRGQSVRIVFWFDN